MPAQLRVNTETDNFWKTSLQTVFEAGLFYDWLNSLEAVALVIIKGVCVLLRLCPTPTYSFSAKSL